MGSVQSSSAIMYCYDYDCACSTAFAGPTARCPVSAFADPTVASSYDPDPPKCCKRD